MKVKVQIAHNDLAHSSSRIEMAKLGSRFHVGCSLETIRFESMLVSLLGMIPCTEACHSLIKWQLFRDVLSSLSRLQDSASLEFGGAAAGLAEKWDLVIATSD